jgi:hypothetical protein
MTSLRVFCVSRSFQDCPGIDTYAQQLVERMDEVKAHIDQYDEYEDSAILAFQ